MNEDIVCSQTIGIWMSDKKSHKLNWKELVKTCYRHGYNLVKIDIEKSIEAQGQINVFLHKLTDIIAAADQGDSKALGIVNRVEQYLSNHPDTVVIDPLDNVRILLNRYRYYTLLHEEPSFKNLGIFTPNFAEFSTNNIEQNIEIMRRRGVTFPVICKPSVAHGSKSAHEMIAIFNERGLNVCKSPCVVQSFVSHNAVLHKVYVIGNRYHICERPSLKNFNASEDLDPIFFSTGEVCKADSQSTLSILDPIDRAGLKMTLNEEKVKHMIKFLRKRIGLCLAGIDVVLDNLTGNHAIIDINVFPSYDNVPNHFEHLLDTIDEIVSKNSSDCTTSDFGDCSLSSYINVGVGASCVNGTNVK